MFILQYLPRADGSSLRSKSQREHCVYSQGDVETAIAMKIIYNIIVKHQQLMLTVISCKCWNTTGAKMTCQPIPGSLITFRFQFGMESWKFSVTGTVSGESWSSVSHHLRLYELLMSDPFLVSPPCQTGCYMRSRWRCLVTMSWSKVK